MGRTHYLGCIALFLLLTPLQTSASPWFTGPILAPSGKTIPRGHVNLETYAFYTENEGVYNRHWRLIHSPGGSSTQANPIFAYGLTDWMDIQYNLPYVINHDRGHTGHHIGDLSATLGFQALEQKDYKWRPDLRVTLQEIFPTGRFEQLNPTNEGTDGTGVGSYQTVVALNFQHLLPIYSFYLRTRLSLSYLNASGLNIRGHNSYGGNADTNGHIKPGNLYSADLAGEFSLTQNWVLVMEGYYFNRSASHFSGFSGIDRQGLPLVIGYRDVQEVSIAPAIEYNFSENYGIIAGVWLSVRGKDAPDFISTVVAFNAYW